MSQLALFFLGPWQVARPGKATADFKYDKVRALLTYLAVEADRPHRREALMGLLWPELAESAARNNLRQAVHALRQALGDRRAQFPYIITSRATMQFNTDADYSLDVQRFVQLVEVSERHAHRSRESCSACARRLQRAAELYRGPFLSDFFLPDSPTFEEWALVKREWLSQMALGALGWLAAYYERRGQYEAARRYVKQELGLEPWREAAHRAMMRLYALEGMRGAALVQYETCRRILDKELGVPPEPTTTALYKQIRDASEEAPLGLEPLALPAKKPHTLPPAPTPFVGRESELAEIGRLIGDEQCRVLTLIGPGGVGKSRLALQAAAEQLDAFSDGVFFVPLASLPAASLLPATVLTALGIDHDGGEKAEERLLTQLREHELLLVLDNFEHLLSGADLLSKIVRRAPQVTILVTSRQRLNLQAEWVIAVGGMPAAENNQGEAAGDGLALFVQSARRARPGFELSATNREHVARICRLVGGLPLAIELAAAWVQLLSCAEIAAQIEKDIAFLTTTRRDVPERHHSLLVVLEHTWRRLSETEQRVLAHLSVFRGGFRLRAAEAVAGASLLLLRALSDKSLLQRDAAGRYQLHELLQRYAAERLQEAGERQALEKSHLLYFLKLAEEVGAQLRSPESARGLAHLEAERDNWRAALERGLGGSGDMLALARRLAAALWPFWYRRGYLAEGREWLARALMPEDAHAPALTATLHHGSGVLAWNQGDYVAASEHYERSLAIRRDLGDEQGMAALLNNLGNLALDQSDSAAARQYLEQSLAIKRRLGDTVGISASLGNLGALAYQQGDHEAARAYLEESVALKRQLGDTSGAAIPLGTLGAVAVAQGEFRKGRSLLEESLQLKQAAGDRWGVAMTLDDLGILAIRQGETDKARRLLRRSLALRRQLADRWSLAHVMESIGRLAAVLEEAEEAASLWGAAEALREEIGSPRTVIDEQQIEQARQTAVACLDAARFESAYRKGTELALHEALEVAARVVAAAD